MILALDTSGAVCVVAVVDPAGQVVFAGTGSRPRAHAEELAPLVDRALDGHSVDAVAVGRGPGSFTGLRVGLVFGQVMAWSGGLSLAGLCSLDVVAAQSDLTDGWAVMDARRGELFYARYRNGRRVGDPDVGNRALLAEVVGDDPVCGDTSLLTSVDRRESGTTRLEAVALGRVAFASRDDVQPATPIYLRRPDVTLSPANRAAGRGVAP